MLDKALEFLFMQLIYCMIIWTDFVKDKEVQYNAGNYFLLTFCLIVLLSLSVMGINTVEGIRHLQRMKVVKRLHRTHMEIIDKTKKIDELRA